METKRSQLTRLVTFALAFFFLAACDEEITDEGITGANDPPVAFDDVGSVAEGSTLNEAAPGVLGNDSDPDGDPLTVTTTPVTPPTNGTLTLNANGSYSYTHDGTQTTSDSFVYEVCDDEPLCTTATVDLTITVNPSVAQAALESVVDQFFTTNQGLASLETFGAAIGTALPSIALVNLTLNTQSPTFHGMAERFRQSMADLYTRTTSRPTLMAGIPVELHGTTFVYDPGSGQYIASARPGAPEFGVRFILYDGIATLNEVGYLDLIDESNFDINPATINITLAVIITDVDPVTPVVSYGVTGTVSETGGTLLITGFLSDGSDQLDFAFQVTGSEATGFSADFTLSVENILSINLNLSETPGGSGTLEALISDGAHEILFVLNIAVNGDILGGSGIFFDDILVATFTGNIEQDTVVLNNAQGDPLTQQELIALANIFVALEQSFLVMEGLFAFGLGLVGVIFFF